MKKILIFGGTVEGRLLSEYLTEKDVLVHICVAGDYAAGLLPESDRIIIHTGRMDSGQMADYIQKNVFDLIIDATHPYAEEATENIKAACAGTGTEYIRLARDTSSEANAIFFDDISSAISHIKDMEGPVFITTGSKEIPEFVSGGIDAERLYARIIPDRDPLDICRSAGIKGSHIICMQGPFDTDMNVSTIRHIMRDWSRNKSHAENSGEIPVLVTKQSGRAGGFDAKIEAACITGLKVMVIGRSANDAGKSLLEVKGMIDALCRDDAADPEVWMIGMGMGREQLTQEAISAIRGSHTVIGAPRMLECIEHYCTGKETISSYNYPEIASYIEKTGKNRKFAVVFSGDPGFYSGCDSLRRCLEKIPHTEHVCSGISTPVHFLDKAGILWEDCAMFSMHGQKLSPVNLISRNRKTLFLLGKETDISDICKKLTEYELADVRVVIGCDLMSDDEIMEEGSPASFAGRTFSALSVIYIENPHAGERNSAAGLDDSGFTRGSIPMTKSAVRSIVMSKLKLMDDSVMLDIGAGTGSVSVEAARAMPYGMVYAIEREREGIDLIRQNSRHFHMDNIVPVCAVAPDVEIPDQRVTHAFIGGSGGRLMDIISWLSGINPDIRIVITAITPETIAEIMRVIEVYGPRECSFTQIQVSSSKKAGSSHLMMGQNPVMVVTLQGLIQNG